ncbi:hypothetical protein MAUB1S_04712 [Mycolicibacterium aubagnense]
MNPRMNPARWNPAVSTPPWYVGLLVAAGLITAEVAVVRLLRDPAPHGTYAIVFMFGVLIMSAGWGLGLSLLTTVASAFAYLQVHLDGGPLLPLKPIDVLTLSVFLPIAGLANVLGWQLRTRARDAHRSWQVATGATERVRELAEQQGALRRIATLIAEGKSPADVLSSVADEVAAVLHVRNAGLVRYEPGGTATLVAAHDEPGLAAVPVGTTFPLDGDDVIAMVRTTGRPARMDTHDDAGGSTAALVRDLGLHACVGVPVTVDGQLWGAMIVGTSGPDALPADTEACVSDFAELIATAIANAHARAELVASRARIVTASDNARRGIERDLHDGAQQRLVTLALQVRTLQMAIPEDPPNSGPGSPGSATACAPPATSCASWRTGYIPRSCPAAGCVPRCATSAVARRCRSRSTSTSRCDCRKPSRSPRTTPSPKPSPMPPSTPGLPWSP